MGPYERKLSELVAITNSLEGTGGIRALRAIIKDLSGHGPISELLYTLDRQNFDKVIELLWNSATGDGTSHSMTCMNKLCKG